MLMIIAQVSFYLTNTYLYSFVLVVKPWSLIDLTYFTSTQTVALTVFGILAGVLMRFQHRYKVGVSLLTCISHLILLCSGSLSPAFASVYCTFFSSAL